MPPNAGVLLAIPLDGKPFREPNPKRPYGVIWILVSTPDAAVIATTRWVGTERQIKTALDDPRSRQVTTRWRLRKNTLAWRIASPPGAVLVGVVAPPGRESKRANSAGDWDDMRAALLDLADVKPGPKLPSRAKPSLATLRRTNLLASWRRHVSAPTLRAAREILSEAVDALSALQTAARPQQALTVVKKAMRATNALERREPFMSTVDAEEVVEALTAIAAAAGIDEETFERTVDVLRDF